MRGVGVEVEGMGSSYGGKGVEKKSIGYLLLPSLF